MENDYSNKLNQRINRGAKTVAAATGLAGILLASSPQQAQADGHYYETKYDVETSCEPGKSFEVNQYILDPRGSKNMIAHIIQTCDNQPINDELRTAELYDSMHINAPVTNIDLRRGRGGAPIGGGAMLFDRVFSNFDTSEHISSSYVTLAAEALGDNQSDEKGFNVEMNKGGDYDTGENNFERFLDGEISGAITIFYEHETFQRDFAEASITFRGSDSELSLPIEGFATPYPHIKQRGWELKRGVEINRHNQN